MSSAETQQTPSTTLQPTTSAPTSSSSTSRGVQLKRSLAGHGVDVQMAALAPIQRKGGEDTDAVHSAAAHGIASGGGAMPYASQIQQSFGGHDVSNIQAHTGEAATQAGQAMGAEAYATGNHVAFAGAPDLHTAAHEAAHVVQQQAGVSLSGGVGQVGDAYENHADQVADAVVKGESAEGLLSEMTGGGPAVQQRSVQRRAIQRLSASNAVQMDATTDTTTNPNPTPPADPDIDLATIKSELATAASGTVGTFTPAEAAAYANQIAPSGTLKRSALDTEKTNCTAKVVSAWKTAEAANPRGFCGAYAGPDAIATRKFGELDAEVDTNYEGGGGAGHKLSFYTQLAGIIGVGDVPRMNTFGKCDAAVRAAGLRMKGAHIAQTQLQPMLERTAGVGGTYDYTTDKDLVAADCAAEVSSMSADLANMSASELLTNFPQVVKAFWAEKGDKKYLKGNLTPPRGGTWFSSGQVALNPGPPDTQFSQLMEIGALQPEWFADGAVRFTIDAAGVAGVAGNCVKPTCLDGMQSGLFVPNNSPNVFGVTGGGFNEFLAASIPSSAVTAMSIISTSTNLRTAITEADQRAKAAGHGSAMDQQERDRNAGTPTPNAGEAQGVYDQVTNRTAQERRTPTPVDANGMRT